MESLQTVIESNRNSPDELYRKAFLYFQALFRPKGDIRKVQLPSHLPESAYSERRALGAVITGALMAILDHRAKTGGSTVALLEVTMYTNTTMPPVLRERLDEIILDQAATTGMGLTASDLVLSRVLEWERHDYSKLTRWLHALDKAARIHQRIAPTPLTEPFRHEVKELALKELRPVLERLQEQFKACRVRPTEDEILKEFEREASNPSLSFLSNSHNLGLWIEFLRTDPLSLLNSSAVELFDNFTAFTSRHDPEYTRQKFSSRK